MNLLLLLSAILTALSGVGAGVRGGQTLAVEASTPARPRAEASVQALVACRVPPVQALVAAPPAWRLATLPIFRAFLFRNRRRE